MRASTLATFELVRTVPERTWPPCATGELSDIERMRGGASGGSRTGGTSIARGPIVAAVIGCSAIGVVCTEYGVALGEAAEGAPVAGGTGCGVAETATKTRGAGEGDGRDARGAGEAAAI